MGEMKAPIRGVDLSHVDEDPFADLADFFEAEMAQGAFSSKPAVRSADEWEVDQPRRDASGAVDSPAFDDEFEQAFADVFAEARPAPMSGDVVRKPLPEAAARSYSGWISPDVAAPGDRSFESAAALHTTRGPARDSDLNQALRGLSAPAKPRQGTVFETQSFAPERVEESEEPRPVVPELDEFDQLIASELAMMKDNRRASSDGTSAFYAPAAYGAEAVAEDVAPGDRSDIDYVDEEDVAAPSQRMRGPFRRNMVALGGGVASLALLGVVGLFVWGGGASEAEMTGSTEPMLIKADAEPYKVAPKDPGGREIPNQNKAVYERVSAPEGQPMPSPKQQALLTDSEEPIDLPAEEPPTAYEDLPGVDLAGSETEGGAEPARLASAASDAATPAAEPVGILQPRKVRTMVVRPDGTLVPAAAEPETVATAPAAASSVAMPGIIEVSSPPRTGPGAADAAPAEAEPTQEASTQAAEADAPSAAVVHPPIPHAAPVDAPVAAAPRQVASAEPAAPAAAPVASTTPVAAPAAALPSGGYFVQISSQPSQSLAQQSLRNLTDRYANVIAGRSVGIQSADIPGKGTFYRVRVAAASKDEASSLCGQLKSAGGNCFVAR